MDDRRSYRFGPVERRGLIGALRTGQLAVVGGCGLVAFLAFLALGNAHPGAAILIALAAAAMAVAGAFVPVAGRTPEEWAPVAWRYIVNGRLGRRRWTSPAIGAGAAEAVLVLPIALSEIDVLAVPLDDRGEREIAVIKDRRAMTYTATLAVKVAAFGLLDHAEQERRLARWGMVLAGLAREGSPVSRVQWLERSLPTDGDEIGRYLAEARDPTVPIRSRSVASYLDLVDTAGAVTQDHELFVSLQIDTARARRAIKRNGGGDQGACAVLARELETFAQRLEGAQIGVRGALKPTILANALRAAYDPYSRSALARIQAHNPERDGISLANAGPMATHEDWDTYRTDSAVHATYWIASWPRLEVPAVFLMPLLTQATVLRAVAVTMEPLSLLRATRETEAARTADLAEEQLRREHGFVTTAKTRRHQEATVRREQELSRGHAELRFAGFVTVTGRDHHDLELASEKVEHAAQQAHLELRRMYGQQAAAFTHTLPLCRGLR